MLGAGFIGFTRRWAWSYLRSLYCWLPHLWPRTAEGKMWCGVWCGLVMTKRYNYMERLFLDCAWGLSGMKCSTDIMEILRTTPVYIYIHTLFCFQSPGLSQKIICPFFLTLTTMFFGVTANFCFNEGPISRGSSCHVISPSTTGSQHRRGAGGCRSGSQCLDIGSCTSDLDDVDATRVTSNDRLGLWPECREVLIFGYFE